MQNFTLRTTYKETVSTVSSKGQVTLPVAVRRYLGVEATRRVAFVIGSSGDVKIARVRYPDIQSLRGAAGSLGRPVSSFKQVIKEAREERLFKKYGK